MLALPADALRTLISWAARRPTLYSRWRLLAHPKVHFAQCRAVGFQIALLPAVVVGEPFPASAGGLEVAAETPAVLVVDGHDVRGVGGPEPRSVADEQQVLVVGAAGLGAEVERSGEDHR